MIEVYTDGAASNNGSDMGYGGWAYLIRKNELDRIVADAGYVPPKATNNKCELIAMIEGCKAALLSCEEFEPINVYSDSAYIVNCFKEKWWIKWEQNGWKNSKKESVANEDLWKELIRFFEMPNFNFIKVKGHSTNLYNSMVDEMAVGAKVNGKCNYTRI